MFDGNLPKFQRALLGWFESQKRDMPWRRTVDPYGIWIAEVMLQQTQVEIVRAYWQPFLDRFPTVKSLAEATLDEVMKAWEGLGYYTRARNLKRAARRIVDSYGEKLPRDPQALRALPGFGPYTTGALTSIAFDLPEPAVDGNVFRVLSRLLGLRDDISLGQTRLKFEGIARNLIPRGKAGSFNQAMMDLGAVVCTPRQPSCTQCPVASYCRSFSNGNPESLPVKRRKTAAVRADMVLVVCHQRDRVVVVKRPEHGLLAGLTAFPTIRVAPGADHGVALNELQRATGIRGRFEGLVTTYSFVFTHLRTVHYVYRIRGGRFTPVPPARWANFSELSQVAFPTSQANAMESAKSYLS